MTYELSNALEIARASIKNAIRYETERRRAGGSTPIQEANSHQRTGRLRAALSLLEEKDY